MFWFLVYSAVLGLDQLKHTCNEQLNSLRSVMMEVFIPQKLSNATNPSPRLHLQTWLLTFTNVYGNKEDCSRAFVF